jgi:hypothetical protein
MIFYDWLLVFFHLFKFGLYPGNFQSKPIIQFTIKLCPVSKSLEFIALAPGAKSQEKALLGWAQSFESLLTRPAMISITL